MTFGLEEKWIDVSELWNICLISWKNTTYGLAEKTSVVGQAGGTDWVGVGLYQNFPGELQRLGKHQELG